MNSSQWFLLYLISITSCNNRQIYERLNVKNLKPSDTRGEAFYASSGDYHDLIVLAEQGKLCPLFVWALQFDYIKEWNKNKEELK